MSDEFQRFEDGPAGLAEKIDLGIIAEGREKARLAAERDMDVLSDTPIAVALGEKTYTLFPPTAGKVRLVLRMVKGLLGQFGDLQKLPPDTDANAVLDAVFSQGLDSFVDVARVLLEPNGRVIDLERLSISREELEFTLTSKGFQKLLRASFDMLDLPGLKKNLPASG